MEALLKHVTAENIAHVISIMTIISCLFLKVPQISNIWSKRSAEGILLKSMLFELTGCSIMTLYNFTSGYDIMTYMEYPFILLQLYVLVYSVLKFKKYLTKPIVPLATASYITIVALVAFEVIPKSYISTLVPICTPLSAFSKLSYIYGIVCLGNADSISLATWVMSILTNAARIFTVYMDSTDMKLMLNYFTSTMLSSAVLLTAIAYQRYPQMQSVRYVRRSTLRDHED